MFLAALLKQPSKFDCLKDPAVLQLEELNVSVFHFFSLLLFALAILHTLGSYKVHSWARALEMRQAPKRIAKRRQRSLFVQLLYFLSEVEVIFAIWAIPLLFLIAYFYNWKIALQYINTRDYTESLFVFVILSMTATRPIVRFAETIIHWLAKGLGGSLSAWWFTLLTFGPLLGSLLTEAGSMALTALLLSHQFYRFHPSPKLAYATLGLLFVNVSVGGILTNFASPAMLILSHNWGWTSRDMLTIFGWKAVSGILLSNSLYWIIFRKEFLMLNKQKKWFETNLSQQQSKETPIPYWITIVHVLFIIWIVSASHYPAIFIASFLFFLGLHQATRIHQYPVRLIRPMLIGLFLAGLVIHGGLQGWWVIKLLYDLSPLSVFGASILLTAFNDNTAISYLATLIPNWGAIFEYAVVAGIVAGGGLTVIGNAPNPAGYAILSRHFNQEIRPTKLFAAALLPTIILYGIFYFFGPLIKV